VSLTRQDQDALERHAGYPHESAAVRMALAGLSRGQVSVVLEFRAYLNELEHEAAHRDRLFNLARARLCGMLGVPVGPNVRERSAP